jgi:hypothetical protein
VRHTTRKESAFPPGAVGLLGGKTLLAVALSDPYLSLHEFADGVANQFLGVAERKSIVSPVANLHTMPPGRAGKHKVTGS